MTTIVPSWTKRRRRSELKSLRTFLLFSVLGNRTTLLPALLLGTWFRSQPPRVIDGQAHMKFQKKLINIRVPNPVVYRHSTTLRSFFSRHTKPGCAAAHKPQILLPHASGRSRVHFLRFDALPIQTLIGVIWRCINSRHFEPFVRSLSLNTYIPTHYSR